MRDLLDFDKIFFIVGDVFLLFFFAMPVRKPFSAGQKYYISNMSRDQEMIRRESADFERFLKTVSSYLHEFSGLQVLAYAVVPDSYHFLLHNQCDGHDISEFVRRLQISYAMYFKKKYPQLLVGKSLFPERFESREVADREHIAVAQRIHLHPIYAEHVEKISDWPYTSAHQVADTAYKSQWETHVPVQYVFRDIVKKRHADRMHKDFLGF